MADILNYQQRKNWTVLNKKEWFKKTLLTISFITMGSIAYLVNPMNNLLSTILVCSISSLMNSIFYLYGINKGIELVRQSHLTDIEHKRIKIEQNSKINKTNKGVAKRVLPKKKIDTK